MNNLRVLHIVVRAGGITDSVSEDINIGIVEAGGEVTMVYLHELSDSLPETIAQHRIGLGLRKINRVIFNWQAKRKIRKILCSEKYDVVLSHRYKPCSLTMPLVREFPSIQFVNVVHGTGHYDKDQRNRTLKRLAHKRFHFVCVSEAVADFMKDTCGLAKTTSPVEIISNSIDTKALNAQQLSRREARATLGIDQETLCIGYVGRLIEIKGVRELIEGFGKIADRHSNVRLVMLGEGVLREELQSLIDEKSLQERITLAGHTPNARQYLKAFDAFILPSYREGLSIALLEAMSSGLPLLLSDIPMNTKTVDDNAIIFKPGSTSDLADALNTFLEMSSEQRCEQGDANRELARSEYDISKFRQRYTNFLFQISDKIDNTGIEL